VNTDVTVIVPAYNAEATLGDTLDALEAQDHPPVDVIVVDDGSTDRSPDIARKYVGRSRHRVTVLEQDNKGPAAARNRGVEATDADIIVFLDADCVPPPDWLAALTGALNDDVVGASCGYFPVNPEHLVARFVDHEIARRQERSLGKEVDVLATYATAYRRDAFLAAGGFSTDFRTASGEDFDLAFTLHQKGGRLLFTDAGRVGHHHPPSLDIYLRQQYHRGYWRVPMYLRNRDKFVRGDSYTGYEAQTQFILANLAVLSLPATAVHAAAPALGLGLLLVSNLPLGIWAARSEPSMLLVAPVLASLRSLAGSAGVYAHLVDRLLGRVG
jgi:glycosyltransferase involved in cell wall biosynthesis